MYALDNQSGVEVMPPLKAQLKQPTNPLWFTEGGNGVTPSYPGADWFNITQAELLNILKEAGIQSSKTELNQIAKAIREIAKNEASKKIAAESKADDAISAANIAQTTANQAVSKATVAQTKADNAQATANNAIPNSKKSSTTDSNSEDTVATSLAVKKVNDKALAAQNAADSKQSPATTLAGYGIMDFKVEAASGDLNTYRTAGIYTFTSIHNSYNRPAEGRQQSQGFSGNLQVISGGVGNERWCHQIFRRHYSGEVYERWQTSNSNDNWSDWKRTDNQELNRLVNSKSAVAVLTGTISHGGTLPLPDGYAEEQCKYLVSSNSDNPANRIWDIQESGPHLHYKTECWVTGRIVHCRTCLGTGERVLRERDWVPAIANYIVIGVK